MNIIEAIEILKQDIIENPYSEAININALNEIVKTTNQALKENKVHRDFIIGMCEELLENVDENGNCIMVIDKEVIVKTIKEVEERVKSNEY